MSENTNEMENLPHVYISVTELEPNPFNRKVYGDVRETIEGDFIDDIRVNGVQVPLLVTAKNAAGKHVIVGGERRYWGAIAAGHTTVPAMVLRQDLSCDELYVKRRTILLNRTQRDRPNTVKMREMKELQEIEQEEAARSQREGNACGGVASGATRRGEAKSGVPGRQSSAEGGRTRDRIARELNVSPKTVERGLLVQDEIDAAEQAGDTERAEHLKELADKSLKAAAEEVSPPKPKAKATPELATPHATTDVVPPLPEYERWVTMAEWKAMSKAEQNEYEPLVLLAKRCQAREGEGNAKKARPTKKRAQLKATGEHVPLPDGQRSLTWEEVHALYGSTEASRPQSAA